MNARFQKSLELLPVYMDQLNNSKIYSREDSRLFPDKGIYAFFENGNALYVGCTDRMKERVKEHGRLGSRHNSATFAFILAKEEAEKSPKKIDLEQDRDVLERDPAFKPIYDEMKERVSKMQIKVVEVEDPVEQTFFEVYAALELGTLYNEWRCH
ncbi:MAG: hypothetical protein WC379_08275 [Methanoregula sp.]